jgi:excisionase family DNA binding protein
MQLGPPLEPPSAPLSNPLRGTSRPRTELVDIEEVASQLGVGIVFVRRLVAERRIPFVKIGKFVRFDPDEVATWIDEQRVGVYRKRSVRRGCA